MMKSPSPALSDTPGLVEALSKGHVALAGMRSAQTPVCALQSLETLHSES